VGGVSDEVLAALTAPLAGVDAALRARFPGEVAGRQAVHTCYVGAHLVRRDTVTAWAGTARAALDAHAPTPAALAAATGANPDLAGRLDAHVRRVLRDGPVEDLRVDLEDGYGIRPDDVEDTDALAAARALLGAAADGTLPASYGLRPKSLDAAVRARGLRSLGLFLSALAASGPPPPGLVITLPKVSAPEQVEVFGDVLGAYEQALGLGRTPLEVQVETPAAVLALPALVAAGGTRLAGLHVGTYDYSAALGIAAEHQASDHPAVELATALMQLAAAGTGVRVADGSSNRLPVGDRNAVLAGWRRHAGLVRRAWFRGIYQGWDLHPAQLVSRHAAVAAAILEGLPAALDRLSAYAAARLDGAVADEPATARALAGHVLRALDARLLDEPGLAGAGLARAGVEFLGGRR
jgi:citrate lyase beta subunit